ncbi:PRC-barrel domain-containing protein [Methylobacterium gregans]|uniref:PRC-barrel domain-containing protein n=1 Tax=Methylobacterium gregans TaxID=374424 RepID=UPI00361DBAC0
MFRLDRLIATTTITLWAVAAVAQTPPGAEAPAAQPAPPPVATPSVATPSVATPSASPAVQSPPPPPPPAAQAPAQQQGTPATVLDTQDYESLLGKGVRGANGDEFGRIIDVVIDKDGRPRAAIIDFGGFLGVGSRKIAVDWRALRFNTDGKPGRISLQLSRNQVRVSPEYKAGEPIVVLGPASPAAPEGEQAAQSSAAAQPAPAQAPAPAPAPQVSPAQTPAAPEKAPDK